MNFKKGKLSYVFMILLILIFVFCGCSSKGNDVSAPKDGGGISSDLMIIRPEETNRKIIYTSNISFETKNISEALNKIKTAIEKNSANAYIDQSNVNYANGYISVRIKTEYMEAFIDEIATIGTVQNINIKAEDVTSKYNSSVSTKEALMSELTALRAARDANMSNPQLMMQYNERIKEVESSLNYIIREIASYDEMVDYSTVNIQIYNIGKTPITEKYTSKIGRVFVGSLSALFEVIKFIGVAIVAIFPFSCVAAVIFVFYKRIEKNKSKKTKKIEPEKKEEILLDENQDKSE